MTKAWWRTKVKRRRKNSTRWMPLRAWDQWENKEATPKVCLVLHLFIKKTTPTRSQLKTASQQPWPLKSSSKNPRLQWSWRMKFWWVTTLPSTLRINWTLLKQKLKMALDFLSSMVQLYLLVHLGSWPLMKILLPPPRPNSGLETQVMWAPSRRTNWRPTDKMKLSNKSSSSTQTRLVTV